MESKLNISPMLALAAGILFLFSRNSSGQSSFDSLKIKQPRHYFATLIAMDGYRKPNRKFADTNTVLSRRLKSYGIRQFSLWFYTPLYTKDKKGSGKDSNVIANTHILLTGNFMSLRPLFDGLPTQHNLIRAGLGIRFIYNTGKKGVWFAELSPFVTRDVAFDSKGYARMASSLIYSHNVSEGFNWRVGVTKSFLWGNRLYLPFVGIRFGSLDEVNLSIQFPRSVQLSVPMGSKVIFSLYSRPQGGVFNFSNGDSLYFQRSDATFHFARYELNSGVRFDFRAGSHFGFFVATGISSRNNITFYSDRANLGRKAGFYNRYFFSKNVGPTLFMNLGLVMKFGRTRSYYKNKNMYDAMDLNHVSDGQQDGNIQIPLKPRKKDLNLESVQDLVDYNDF